MKKIIIFLAMALFCCFSTELQAEEITPKKPLTLIILKNDIVNSEDNESYNKQSAFIYFHNGLHLGGGINVTTKPELNYAKTKLFATINEGPYYILAGLSTDSDGADYFQGGIWWIDSFKKLKVFLDLSNYVGIGGETTDYVDLFLEVEHPISEKFYAGLDLDYIRYWQDENHNFYFLGPYVGYKVTDVTSVFLRVSREWDVVDGQSSRTDAVRVGLEITY